MGWFAIAATAAAGVGKAVGSIAEGNAKNAALQFEADQLDEQAKMEQLRANKYELDRRTELKQSMASFSALQSGRNIAMTGGSADAIREQMQQDAANETRIARFNNSQARRNLNMNAKAKRAQGRHAKSMGLFNAAVGLVGTAGDVYGMGQDKYGWGSKSPSKPITYNKVGGPT